MDSLTIMGIDPGLTRCGFSIVHTSFGKTIYPRAVGVVRTDKDLPKEQRLLELYDAAMEWMDEYNPDVLAIERLFQRDNVSTIMNTVHGSGVLNLAAAQHGIPVFEYTPSEVKKAITGNGNAGKDQVTYMVTKILGLSEAPKPADAADALAIAVCHGWKARMNSLIRSAQ